MATKRSPLSIASYLLIALLLSSCMEDSTAAGRRLALVPSDALGAIIIDNPARFFMALSEGWVRAGIGETLGKNPRSFIEGIVPFAATAEGILDPGRPWVLVLLDKGIDPEPLLILPFRADPGDLVAAAAEAGLQELARAQGYLALGAKGSTGIAIPARSPADLSVLDRFPEEALTLWTNPTRIKKLAIEAFIPSKPTPTSTDSVTGTGAGFPGIADGFRDALREHRPNSEAFRALVAKTDEAKDSPSSATSLLQGMGGMAARLLSNLGSISAALLPSKSGLVVRIALGAARGSEAEALLVKVAASPSALPWTNHLPANALFSASWTLNPQASAALLSASNSILSETVGVAMDNLESGGLDGTNLDALREFMELSAAESRRWNAVMGTRGALSFDLGGKSVVPADSAAPDPIALIKTLSPRLRWWSELGDSAGAATILDGIPSSPPVSAVLESIAKDGGPDIRLMSTRKREGNFSWNELSNDGAALTAGGLAASDREIGAMMDALSSSLTLRWKTGQAGLFATNEDVAVLRQMVIPPARASRESLAASPAFAAFARMMPARVQYVAALSTRRLAALVKQFIPSGSDLPIDPERFGTWVSWYLAEVRPAEAPRAEVRPAEGGGEPAPGSLLEIGFGIPSSDIGALVELALAVHSNKEKI